jgi:hypothetical protein
LIDFCCDALVKDDFSRMSSGIVFAGFGHDEKFPSLISFDLDGFVGKRIKRKETNFVDTSRDMTGAIVPFAQRDMMFRFMEGVDPDFFQFLSGAVATLLVDNCLAVVDQYVPETEVRLQKIKDEVTRGIIKDLAEFYEQATNYRRRMYVDSIIDTIVILPKEELANMAESLVSLTALSRRVSLDVESVGGPIDVAVVSKGDGLIWVKRKHYFKAEQNPHFFANYFRRWPEQEGSKGA